MKQAAPEDPRVILGALFTDEGVGTVCGFRGGPVDIPALASIELTVEESSNDEPRQVGRG